MQVNRVSFEAYLFLVTQLFLMPQRPLVLYIATSVDGYIAAPGDDLSFLDAVQSPGEDYGYSAFIETVDTVIVGKRTYDKVLQMGYPFPHADKEAYIITRTSRASIGNNHFYTGDILTLVQELKAREGKTIFCDGGAQVVNLLLQHQLIDTFILSIIPVLLGSGTRLFDQFPRQALQLVSSRSFPGGLVQLHYQKV